jgi:hypothetical protein
MSEEWVRIPTFPDYEVTITGDIRTVVSKQPVEIYMGRTKVGENLHPRVRIQNITGFKSAHALKDLIKDTFGDRIKEVARQERKAVERKIREESVRPRGDFRRHPEFSKYEISKDGEVRNNWTKKTLAYTQNSRTGSWSYSLRTNDGKSTQRSRESLLRAAWPENFPPPTEKEPNTPRAYARRGWYREIPGYPKYEIHPDGKVRYKNTRRPRPTEWDGDIEYAVLFSDEGSVKRKIEDLVMEVFPDLKEVAA